MLNKTLKESIPDSATGYEGDDYKKTTDADNPAQQKSAKQQPLSDQQIEKEKNL